MVLANQLDAGCIKVGDLDNLDHTIELLELGDDSLLELLVADTNVGDRGSHAWGSEGRDVRGGWGLQILSYHTQVLGREKASAVVKGPLASDLVRGTRDLEWLVLKKR